MERQAKDGTFYRSVGNDEWEPVTRQAKDGTVYKKVGQDSWSPIETPKPDGGGALDTLVKVGQTIDSYTGAPTRAAIGAAQDGNNPLSAFGKQFGEDPNNAPTGKQLVMKAGVSDQAMLSPTQEQQSKMGIAERAISRVADPLNIVPGFNLLPEETKDWIRKNTFLKDTSRADAAGFGMDVAGDVSNVVPLGAIAKGTAKVAGKAAGAAGRFAGGAGKRMLSALGGVEGEVIESYLKNPERIRNAKSFDELYEDVTSRVSTLFDDMDAKKLEYDDATKQLDEMKKTIKESRIESKAQALEEVSQAQAHLDEAYKARKAQLTDKASAGRIEPLVDDAMSNLKQRVSDGSQESYKILDDDTQAYSVRNAGKILRTMADDMNIKPFDAAAKTPQGSGADIAARVNFSEPVGHQGLPVTAQSRGVQSELIRFAEMLEQTPQKVPAVELKKILQQIDNSEKAMYGQPGFDSRVSQAYKMIRATIDDAIKTNNPAYRDQMSKVADDTRVFSDSLNKFGKQGSRMSRLQNIARPSAKYDLETLNRLAAKEGGQLPQMVKETVEAQRTLRSPMRMESVKRALPQNEAVRAAEMKVATTKRMAKPREIRNAIARSAEFYKARSAQANLKTAQDLAKKFKSFGEQGAEAKLLAVSRGKKYATKTLEELGRLSDEDFVEAVNAAADAAAFTKTAFHGSRNVNIWAAFGAAVMDSAKAKGGAGAAVGTIFGGPAGLAMGAVIGGMMDVFGPAVTKRVLDGIIHIKGPVTESAIRRIPNVPDSAKQELVKQFRATMATGRASTIRDIPKAAGGPNELDDESSVPARYQEERN